MVASANSDTEDDEKEPGFIGFEATGRNKNNSNKNGGEIINNEFFLSCDDGNSSDPDSNAVETSDDDVRVAREELHRLKLKQKDVAKKTKLDKIVRESNNIRKSLGKSSGKKKTTTRKSSNNNNVVTLASLRKMDDVVSEVDRLMDGKNFKASKRAESSSGSDSSATNEVSDHSEFEEKPNTKEVEGDQKRRSTKGHRSGKSKTITSNVKYPQEWPHSHLSLHFVNRKKDYEEPGGWLSENF